MTVPRTLVAHGATLAMRQAAFPADEPLLEDPRPPTVIAPWRGVAGPCCAAQVLPAVRWRIALALTLSWIPRCATLNLGAGRAVRLPMWHRPSLTP